MESYQTPEVKEFVLAKFKGAVLAELVRRGRPKISRKGNQP